MAPFDNASLTKDLNNTLEIQPDSLLSASEWAFIKEISDLFPDREPSILKRFQDAEKVPARERLKYANQCLKDEKRRGFVQRLEQGVTPEASAEDIEDIFEHSKNMRLILRRIFNTHKDHPYLQRMSENEKSDMLIKSFRLAAVHDMAEALTSDFTPIDMEKITPAIKRELESLACKILFEAFPKKMEMVHRYETKDRLKSERNIDHLNKVTDLLEGGIDCLAMNVSKGCFDEWMNSIEKGLKKYKDLSLCFASQALTDLRNLRSELPDLVNDYPDIQDRREAIMDIVFGHLPANTNAKPQPKKLVA